jgi:hypothetical protein
MSVLKVPLLLLSVKRIQDYLEQHTDKEIIVNKTHKDITLYIDGHKVYLPLIQDTLINLEPENLINSLKEKGLIP